MALIPCPECEKQISDTAESCPQCGYKLTAEAIAKIKQHTSEIPKSETPKRKKHNSKQSKHVWQGLVIMLVVYGIIAIVVLLVRRESSTTETWQAPTYNSTESFEYRNPRPLPEPVETPQEPDLQNEAFFGTWSLKTMDGESAGVYLANDLQPDVFVSWTWTFYTDGNFRAKLIQDTGEGWLTTTTFGTYTVFSERYTTTVSRAIMSFGETSQPLNMSGYRFGTWSREGNTLTIIPDGSVPKVFKFVHH